MKIAVLTNDKANWALKPFCYLFNKFWDKDQPVDIVGFNTPQFSLPDNFKFISLDNRNWPASQWTNQLITYLNMIDDDQVILFLEDYWLCEQVDLYKVNLLYEYCRRFKPLRLDLTADRLNHKHVKLKDGIIKSTLDADYRMSYQTGIWNREQLLEVLLPNENAWQSEVDGSKRLDNYEILGTNFHPVKYVPVLRRNRKGLQYMDRFNPELRREILELVPEDKR